MQFGEHIRGRKRAKRAKSSASKHLPRSIQDPSRAAERSTSPSNPPASMPPPAIANKSTPSQRYEPYPIPPRTASSRREAGPSRSAQRSLSRMAYQAPSPNGSPLQNSSPPNPFVTPPTYKGPFWFYEPVSGGK